MKIADFQDRRQADSLYRYFKHENALYRHDAVLAFGSLQDTSAVDRIGTVLLTDPDAEVRHVAAFALGQLQHPACERFLLDALEKEAATYVTVEILHAYGKTTSEWKVDPSIYLEDTTTAAGVAWSIYRAGLRGKANADANAVARDLLKPDFSQDTRLGAAHFFARGARDFQEFEKELIASAREDHSAEVRMAAALSLGKIHSDSALAALKGIIKNDTDARVLTNSVRALGSFPYPEVKHYLYEALNHQDVNVEIAASEQIVSMLSEDDWIEVSSLTNLVANWRVQANLYEASLKAGQNRDLAQEIKDRYGKAADPHQKAALLGSLKHYPQAYLFVHGELLKADTAIIRSAAASTLVGMNQSRQFEVTLRTAFAKIYQELIQSQDDPAVLGTIASALSDSSLGFREILQDPSFLYDARRKLLLPEHNESLQSIEAAIAHFEKRKGNATVENNFNHSISWELVRRIPGDQRAIIRTSRGNIIIRFFVNESPGSVANFVALAQENYFDNKAVHRVVPNFVIQDGCKRGDGWGSENYSIRSEFSPRRYRTGSVGMASAGKDTEGTQWFITHSPTPHLDGRYTIFAEVIEGMRVVDFIQVGDKILDVEVENSEAR
ncbi:MAG: peptidylprolyl isomerase [Cyclobacteriaceae bacterium]